MALKPLPDNVDTEIDGQAFIVTDKRTKELIVGFNLKWMADRLVKGERITQEERQAVGMALHHLRAIAK